MRILMLAIGLATALPAAAIIAPAAAEAHGWNDRRDARQDYRRDVRDARRDYDRALRHADNRREAAYARRAYERDLREARRDYYRDARQDHDRRDYHRGW
ncbi:MAG: hypothetical protein ACREB5_00800 [Sphingomonadaceae bacterium]